jgi:formate-dependent phosphoribosylglycinamide formyltransferase (GAR transformylase)
MHVIFVEPAFPFNQRKFLKGLADVGARVSAISEYSADALGDLKHVLSDFEQVRSVVHEESMIQAVRNLQRRSWVDRLEATVEAHVMNVARVREACGIPGTSVQTTYLCRDKPAMKEFLRRAGVPCAQSTGVDSVAEGLAFAERVGYPLIVKPRDGAGASGTSRVDSHAQLERALTEAGVGQGASVAIEEFIEGHEGFFDTITVGGEVAHEFVTHYYPGVLEAMRHREVSPVFIATNRLGSSGYDEVKALGRKVIQALGLDTSATHMEWFFGPKGLKFSEIGCRPPGVGAWDLYCASNDLDVYREWAAAVALGHTLDRPSQRFSAGLVNLRPTADGRITGYEGVEEMQRALGDLLIDHHFPPVGSRTQPVSAGYMANAWVRVKHPDYDQLRELLATIGRRVRVHAG